MWGKRPYWGLARHAPLSGDPPPAPPAWTVDPALGWACPANATEWAAIIADEPGNANLAAWSSVTSIYPCQEESGVIVDTVSGVNLAVYGSGHNYRVSAPGATRKGLQLTAGVTGGWRNVSTSIPDLSTTSCLIIAYVYMPPTVSAVYSGIVMGGATPALVRISTSGLITATSGGNAASGIYDERGKIVPIIFKYDHTAGIEVAYTLRDKIVPTLASLAGRSFYLGSPSNAGEYIYLWAARCDGAAGERTDDQVKALLTKFTGSTPTWS